ncbi:hypothetical protein RhiirB3_434742 [Rhizophagus irregularis]|nr:hypothetical protein RhiirB3_434742 [Rhizophagus irregularis]
MKLKYSFLSFLLIFVFIIILAENCNTDAEALNEDKRDAEPQHGIWKRRVTKAP